MANTLQQTTATGTEPIEQFDAIVIGAGVSGLYQLYRLRQLGLSVRCFEDGSGVGGTWYWNRYPGCRFDSESETYGYSWSKELLQEWDWKEHFSGQPENERYLNYVADKFDLRRDIQFNSRVKSAVYDEKANRWEIELESGQRARAQFLIAAVGILSARYTPPFRGNRQLQGRVVSHLALAEGKSELHRQARGGHRHRRHRGAAHPDRRQRSRPSHGLPAHAELLCAVAQWVGVPGDPEPVQGQLPRNPQTDVVKPRLALRTTSTRARPSTVPKEERLALYEELWAQPGFTKWLGNFHDIMTNREANEDFAEFVRNKIRARVKDPVVAEKLVPKDHPFGSKRIPLETEYYEAYNRDNVLLVDRARDPDRAHHAQRHQDE